MSLGVWNQLDETALYLGLDRSPGETDESFLNKIKSVSKYRFKPDYYNLSKVIPAQSNLITKPILIMNSNKSFNCTLDWEYFTFESEDIYIRVFINTQDCTLRKITDILDKFSDNISYILYKEEYKDIKCRQLIRNSNYKFYKDYIYNKRSYLDKKYIIKGTLTIDDNSEFINEVESIQDLKMDGDYFVDYEKGYIEIFNSEINGTYVKYFYNSKRFIVEYTEMLLFPLNVIEKYGIVDNLIYTIPYIYSANTWSK